MAVTSDNAVINACDDKGQWTGVNFSPDDNTSGSVPWWAFEPSGATAHGVSFVGTTGTTGSIHEDTNVDMTGQLLVFWLFMAGKEEIKNVTILNLRMHEGAAATGDSGQWDQPIQPIADAAGGFVPLYAWPTQPDVETGTFVPADVSSFELELRNNSGTADIKVVGVDYVHRISEVRVSGTTPTIHKFVDITDADVVGFWGVVFKAPGAEQYTCRVRIEIGLVATTTDFEESGGKVLTFIQFNSDQKLYFDFIDGTTGGTDFILGLLSGGNPVSGITINYDTSLFTGTDSSDIFNNPANCDIFRLYDTTIIGANEVDLPNDVNAEVNFVSVNGAGTGYLATDTLTVAGGTGTSATIDVLTVGGGGEILTAVVLANGDYSVDPSTVANAVTGGTGSGATFDLVMARFHEVRSCKFDTCGAVVPGTCRVEDSIMVNGVAEGARITSTSHQMKNNRYIGCDDGIEFTTAGTYTIDGDQFSGSVQADFHHSGTGTVTINVVGGASGSGAGGAFTTRVSGGGTIVVNNNKSVTFTNLIVGSEVRVYLAGTSTEVDGVESTVGTTFAFTIGSGVAVDYVILGPIGPGNLAYVPIRVENISFAADATIVVPQQINRNFRDPV